MYIAKKTGSFSYADQTKVVTLKEGDSISADTPAGTILRWLSRGVIEKVATSFSVSETKTEGEATEVKTKSKKAKPKNEDEV